MIVAFLCKNCAQGSANTAGVLRMKYDDRINIIRVPCAGRVGPRDIFDALNEGAEAVSVIGCCFGACHYRDANLVGLRRVKILKKFLTELGYSPNTLTAYTARAAEGDTVVGDFEEIIELTYAAPEEASEVAKNE
ncbi:MAG: hydrogenase iron-sulfur subunit [Candidatus Hermodarchaeota archaeon]